MKPAIVRAPQRIRVPIGAFLVLDAMIVRAAPSGELVPVVLGGHPHGSMSTEPIATLPAPRRAA